MEQVQLVISQKCLKPIDSLKHHHDIWRTISYETSTSINFNGLKRIILRLQRYLKIEKWARLTMVRDKSKRKKGNGGSWKVNFRRFQNKLNTSRQGLMKSVKIWLILKLHKDNSIIFSVSISNINFRLEILINILFRIKWYFLCKISLLNTFFWALKA